VVRASWDRLGSRDFDAPSRLAAYLHALRWNCVTATNPRLFQSPWRAGIEVMAYQLEPLRKALRLPRVNLFIADDVGLGKTIEAGLVLRELIMRQRVRRAVVVAPPSVVICSRGGTIYNAEKRLRWPGKAAVVVAVVSVAKGEVRGPRHLNGKAVDTITAYLLHRGGNSEPARLPANTGTSFIGYYLLGAGFTFDDEVAEASPIQDMGEATTSRGPGTASNAGGKTRGRAKGAKKAAKGQSSLFGGEDG
jgi:hypothetical protein